MVRDDITTEIKRLAAKYGGQGKLAKELGVSAPFMSDLTAGRRRLSVRMARELDRLGAPGTALYIQQAKEAVIP